MKWNSKSITMKYAFISRITLLLSIVSWIGATILLMVHSVILLVATLFVVGVSLFFVSLMVPGMLLICKRPNLAYAWRNGRYLLFSDASWELLSSDQKRSFYFESMFTLLFVIAFTVWALSEQ